MTEFTKLTDEEWRERLSGSQYRVLRQAGTDRPFSAAYEQFKHEGAGTYVCTGCGMPLFTSETKFDARCGWPAFYDPASNDAITTKRDASMGVERIEVVCARCEGHLGHLFEGEGFNTPTDERYCINATSLRFVPDEA
ncbi:peptide-methionine (R)-S-oxide reductase MsrB [Synoicihabitans lomoniglobus]|uniref:peptide-methionine (R)-S-oxide reductase n=1 Tax=Synoicihabitans lomoniglobus TaxID=2909285 RepID=A0AAE9ZXA8_9BACT|nr:peptide-methionine (R)-S-oxide reductase MsrB [Opitutaceae bacterium LMO-M01]WED64615.1 peptide-methionine (R)-S-oxide reductase MsrB [Opitutaceae bacterium LMO-M01]